VCARTLTSVLSLLLGLIASAADKNPSACTLAVATDRADCVYRRGEQVTFTIAVSLRGTPVNDAKVTNDTEKPSEQAVNAVRYYDAVNFAARTKAQAFITVGFIDIVCPPTGVYAAYNQLSGKKQIWNHLDTGRSDGYVAGGGPRFTEMIDTVGRAALDAERRLGVSKTYPSVSP
jgi:hypothetical protein